MHQALICALGLYKTQISCSHVAYIFMGEEDDKQLNT